MPYQRSALSQMVTVGPMAGPADWVSLYSLQRGAKVGDKVTFLGEVKSGGATGTPVSGAKITLRMYTSIRHWPDDWANLGDIGYTDVQGKFSFAWTVPIEVIHYLMHYKLACNDWVFKAQVDGSSLWSNEYKVFVSYLTRIVNLNVPTTVQVAESFKVSGNLQYEDLPGIWLPLSGKEVVITYNSTVLGKVTTNLLGGFEVSGAIQQAGEFNIIAEFAGSNYPAAALGRLSVGGSQLMALLPIGLGIAAIVFIAKARR